MAIPLIKREVNLFWLAIGFFTRLPTPRHLDFSQQQLNHASRYFSLVGSIVGGLCALVFLLASRLFSNEVAIVLSMGFGFLLTGGFHEDGLADTADGLGGGWTPEQKLSIMKDSRLGSYGALAIWFALTLKFLALSHSVAIVVAILVAHPLSRLMSTLLIPFLPYVTSVDGAKSKPLAENLTTKDTVIAIIFTLPVLAIGFEHALYLAIVVLITTSVFGYFVYRQINGFTGDVLGAAQQINELTIYLWLLAIGYGQ